MTRPILVFAKRQAVSPWHDVPLAAPNGAFNMIVEIPKETKAKVRRAPPPPRRPFPNSAACDHSGPPYHVPIRSANMRRQSQMEVATDEASTPIKQDTKKGKLRDYP